MTCKNIISDLEIEVNDLELLTDTFESLLIAATEGDSEVSSEAWIIPCRCLRKSQRAIQDLINTLFDLDFNTQSAP